MCLQGVGSEQFRRQSVSEPKNWPPNPGVSRRSSYLRCDIHTVVGRSDFHLRRLVDLCSLHSETENCKKIS